MAEPTAIVEAQFDRVNWVDITADVSYDEPIAVTWGITGSGPTDNCAAPAVVTFALINGPWGGAQGRYSPGHASCTAGWDLSCPVRVRLAWSIYNRTLGPYRVTEILPGAGQKSQRLVRVSASDWLDAAADETLAVAPQTDVLPGTLMAAIVTSMTTAPTATDYDTGTETWPYTLRDLTGPTARPLAAFKGIAQSDGGFVYLTAGGTLTFAERRRRLGDLVVDVTFASNTMRALSVPRTRQHIVNSVRATVHPMTKGGSLVRLAMLDSGDPPIAANASLAGVTLVMEYTDPSTGLACSATGVIDDVAGAYAYITANSRPDGSGTSMTAACDCVVSPGATSATFQIVNARGSVDAYITALEVWGYTLTENNPVLAIAKDPTSIGTFGERAVDVDLPYQDNLNDGLGIAQLWQIAYADATVWPATVGFLVNTDALRTALMTLDVGSRVALTETVTGQTSREMWVNGMAVTLGGSGVRPTLALVLAPATTTHWWTLDDAVYSKLDVGTVLAPG